VKAVLAEQITGRTPPHQLVQKVLVDAHAWVSSSQSYHARAQNSGQSPRPRRNRPMALLSQNHALIRRSATYPQRSS
jgi:hypothetical protein